MNSDKSVRGFVFPCLLFWFGVHVFLSAADWIAILFFALTIVIGFAYCFYINEEKKLREDIDQLIDLLHHLEEQDVRLPLKDDVFGVLKDELWKILVSQRQIRDEAVKAKEQLKRNMEDITHQIKTALTAVLLLLELLKSDPVNALEYQEHIYREVERLYELSDLLLKLSSLDVGVVDLNKTSFSAKELVIDAELSLST